MALLVPKLPEGETFGVLAEFDSPKELHHACERVRDAGYTRWDAHSPFPIHGLDRAMGMKRSKLPFLVLVVGLAGAGSGLALQGWVHSLAYPLVISGKPFFAWPAYVPIIFELGVLFAAAAAVFGMFGMNQLPMLHHPLFHSERFARVTDDKFFISIEAWDPKFDTGATPAFLQTIGAKSVEVVPRRA